jgi:putative flippase GtrA
MTATEAPTSPVQTVLRRRGVRQFVKFCIVGASSTLIDFAVFYLLIEVVHLQQHISASGASEVMARDLARTGAVFIAFLLAVTNGFYWNNRWTFRAGGQSGLRERYLRFVVTNAIGLGLNLSITLGVARLCPPFMIALLAPYLHKDPAAFFGKAIATVIVVFWNFTASKYWTFKS